MGHWKRWGAAAGVVVFLALLWLATTDDVRVWPARNTVQYHTVKWWWGRVGAPQPGEGGSLRGVVRDTQGRPISDARVLVSWWDGTAYHATTGSNGAYVIPHVPEGSYRPVAGAPGYADVALGSAWLPWTRVDVAAGAETLADIVLPDAVARVVPPGQGLAVGDPETLECAAPLPSQAVRRRITFDSGGQPNQTTLLYTPTPSAPPPAPAMRRPLLLTVYPGPADGWECASVPLAAAGYAVLAIGPAYSFDLERDVDDLARLLGLARAGRLPGVDGTRIALLGGSYSALHVQRLLSRGAVAGTVDDVKAVVLLGPPTDLFTMRRRLEDGTFIPPFGLDQALIALGFPDWRPLRYWRYSGAFHVRHDQPPTAIIHSRKDEVVPVQQSEFLAAMLAQVGAPHELHIFDEASHYLLSEGGDALAIYQITLDFLARQLG